MKSILFVLALAGAPAFAEVPTLVLKAHVQTQSPAVGFPVLVKQSDGTSLLVQIEKGNQLVAYSSAGVVAQRPIDPPGTGQAIDIGQAGRNQAGDLVVILHYRSDDTSVTLYSINMTRQTSTILAKGLSAEFKDRLHVGQKNLALVTVSLNDRSGNTSPAMVYVEDEDSGMLVNQTRFDDYVDGKLGINSAGQLRVLIFGYNLLGLINPSTGWLTSTIASPPNAPVIEHLANGDFIGLDDGTSLKLLDIPTLFDGQLKAVQTFSNQVAILDGRLAVDKTATGFLVTDLTTGKPVAPAYAVNLQAHSRQFVSSVTLTAEGAIAVLSEPAFPNMFVPGTILNYVNLNTGKLLRNKIDNKKQMSAQVFMANGTPIAIEQTDTPGGRTYTVINLDSDYVLNQGTTPLLYETAFQSAHGFVMGIIEDGNKQVCVADLLNEAQRSCLSDPLVQPAAVEYGYGPMSIDGDIVTLPLNLTPTKNSAFPSIGFAQFEVD